MFGNMGGWEIMAILLIVLLLFGPKNLPRLAQSIGKSVRELKNGLSGLTDDIKETVQAPPPERPAAQPPSNPPSASAPVNSESSESAHKPDQTVV